MNDINKILSEAVDDSTEQTKEIYNVVDFGADSSGVSDSTIAFEDCIKAANGNPIIIPDGTYIVNHCVPSVNSSTYYETPVIMIGIGRPIIKRTVVTDTDVSQSASRSMFIFSGVKSAYFNNITFDSQRDNFISSTGEWLGTGILYFFNGGANVCVENCMFKNCSREAIYCKGDFDNVIVRNNIFENTSANFWSTNGNLTDFVFEDNYTNNCRTIAVEIDTENEYKTDRVYIRNNCFKNIIKTAAAFSNTHNAIIENNSYDFILPDDLDSETLAKMGTVSSMPYFVFLNTNTETATNPDENNCSNIIIRNNIGKAHRAIDTAVNAGTTGVTANDKIFNNITIENNTFECANTLCRATNADEIVSRNNTISGRLTMGAHSFVDTSNVTAYDNKIYGTVDKITKAEIADRALSADEYKFADLCRLELSSDAEVSKIDMTAAIGQTLSIIVSGADLDFVAGGNILTPVTVSAGSVAECTYTGSGWSIRQN